MRALVRHEQLWEALRIGSFGDQTAMAQALIRTGQHLQALVWDTAFVVYQEYGHLRDHGLFRMIASGLWRLSPDYSDNIAPPALDNLVDSCFSSDLPDQEAGRQWLANLLDHYMVDCEACLNWLAWHERGGEPPRQALADIELIREQIDSFRAGRDRQGPYTTAQFRQLVQDREEIIAGVLVARQLGLVGAPTKTLKTLISLDMAISIATGTTWLNHPAWPCGRPRRVGFLSGESGPDTLLHKHNVIAQAKLGTLLGHERSGFHERLAGNLLWDDRLPDLGDAAAVRQLGRTIRRHQLEVLFIDPLSLAIGSAAKDLANLAIGGQVILRAADTCRRAGCTLVLLHHTSGDRQRFTSDRARQPLDLTDIAYPAIANHARQWITLNRDEPYDEQDHRNVIWLRAGGSGLQAGGTFRVTIVEGHDHDHWDVTVESQTQYIHAQQAQADQQQQAEERELERAVLYHLRQNRGATANAMVRGPSRLGIGFDRLDRVLSGLQSRGAVRCEQRGNTRSWFSTSESEHWHSPQDPTGGGENANGQQAQ